MPPRREETPDAERRHVVPDEADRHHGDGDLQRRTVCDGRGLVAEADTDTGLRTLTSAAVTELLDHGFSRVPPTGYD